MHELLSAIIQYGDTLSITKAPPVGNPCSDDGQWVIKLGAREVKRTITWNSKDVDVLDDAILGMVNFIIRSAQHA